MPRVMLNASESIVRGDRLPMRINCPIIDQKRVIFGGFNIGASLCYYYYYYTTTTTIIVVNQLYSN
jgi:hypothetical protein